MRNKRRETILKLAAGAVVGIFVLDQAVLTPASEHWKQQGERIGELRQKVERGRQLLERESSLRSHWAEMQRANLPSDTSAAENGVFKAIGRWALESSIGFNSLNPEWRKHDKFETFGCHATASGTQTALGRLLYAMESDPLPVRIESFEITERDAKTKLLTLSLQFSVVRLPGKGMK